MEYTKFIDLINRNKSTYAKTWAEQVKNSEYMETYSKLDDAIILERGEAVFTHLSSWLESGASNDVAEKYFEEVGKDRFKERFPLTEVVYALYLVKKIFWACIAWNKEVCEEVGETKCENCVEFLTIINNYFDLGNFYITRGYFQKIFHELDSHPEASKQQISEFLKKGTINLEDLDKEEFVWRHV